MGAMLGFIMGYYLGVKAGPNGSGGLRTGSGRVWLQCRSINCARRSRFTQLQLAEILGVNQGEVSKIEHRRDICISTLAEYIEAMGGRLEIRAVFKDREVRITQFEELAS